jgi:hypothetical protein
MRLWNLSLALALVVSLAPATLTRAHADDNSHRAAVLELCNVMDLEHVMQESMKRMIDLQLQQAPQIQNARPQFEQFFGKYLSWNALKDDYVKLYMDAFSEPELRELTAFYKTPTGKKAVRQMPTLLQKGAELGASRVREHMGELMQMLQSAGVGDKPAAGKPAEPPLSRQPASSAPAKPAATPATKPPATNATNATNPTNGTKQPATPIH